MVVLGGERTHTCFRVSGVGIHSVFGGLGILKLRAVPIQFSIRDQLLNRHA
jgi:hypothetical protein